ncbi:MAG: leucine-rich repeat domain-containing protein, partial [Clostridia bacterium]|nr:leucine-rich repeat domain-containing protein [Clostridia bacterium]
NPDTSKPVSAVGKFTINTDEYVEIIYIGKDVEYIDETSFFYCKELKSIEVDEANEYYTSVDGVLYTKDMKKLMVYPIKKVETSYTIPEGVERIGACAFYKNETLTEVNIPSTLKEIGDMAFFKCEKISLVTLPDGLEKIGSDAFSYCQGMTPVMYIPDSVKEIGSFAFYSCSNLKEFYMGAQSEEQITFGDSWLPKNIKKVVVNVAPKEQYGKTRDDANQRINELIAEGGEK